MELTNIQKDSLFYKLLFIFIAFIIATDGILIGFKILGIDISRFFQFLSFLFIISSFYKSIFDNYIFKQYIKLGLAFIFFIFLKLFTTTFILEDEIRLNIINNISRVVLSLIFIYLVYFILLKKFSFLKYILIFNLPIMLIAFFQFQIFPFSDIAWDIRFNYFNFGHVNTFGTVELEENMVFRKRVVGLYSTSVPLAYVLVTNMIIGLYLYLKEKNILYFIYFIIIGITAVFSLTRSAVLAFLILFIYIVIKKLYKSNLTKKIFFLLGIIFLILFSIDFYNKSEENLSRVTSVNGNSATGRIPLVITGAAALIQYPFGISKEKYQQVKKEMYYILKHPNVLKFTSHNGLMNLGFNYTLFGLIYFLFIFYFIFKKLKMYISKEYYLFFIISSIAYLSNGFFHNNFIFNKDFYGLILLSLIAYEYNFQKRNKEKLI